MKQTKILHTQDALIMGSITERTETIKLCDVIWKDQKNYILMILFPNIIYHCNLQYSNWSPDFQIDHL